MIFLLTVLMWYTTLNNFQMLNQPTSLEQAQLAVYYPLYINYIQRSCLISLLSGSPIGLFPSSVCSLDFFLIWFYFLGCLILFFFLLSSGHYLWKVVLNTIISFQTGFHFLLQGTQNTGRLLCSFVPVEAGFQDLLRPICFWLSLSPKV